MFVSAVYLLIEQKKYKKSILYSGMAQLPTSFAPETMRNICWYSQSQRYLLFQFSIDVFQHISKGFEIGASRDAPISFYSLTIRLTLQKTRWQLSTGPELVYRLTNKSYSAVDFWCLWRSPIWYPQSHHQSMTREQGYTERFQIFSSGCRSLFEVGDAPRSQSCSR